MRQHVHDNDLKALFFDFQHMLALKRYEEDDAAARSVVMRRYGTTIRTRSFA